MTEDQLLAEVTALCDHLGLLWHHDPDSRRSKGTPGFPDLVIAGRHGRTFRELKSEEGETSPDQDRWMWIFNEIPARYIWRPSDWHSGRIREQLEELC